MLQIPIAVLSS